MLFYALQHFLLPARFELIQGNIPKTRKYIQFNFPEDKQVISLWKLLIIKPNLLINGRLVLFMPLIGIIPHLLL